jgi:hypothetical protein
MSELKPLGLAGKVVTMAHCRRVALSFCSMRSMHRKLMRGAHVRLRASAAVVYDAFGVFGTTLPDKIGVSHSSPLYMVSGLVCFIQPYCGLNFRYTCYSKTSSCWCGYV